MTEQKNDFDFDRRSGVDALVARLGGLRPCAAQLELAVGTVQGWKKRGSIPPAHQQKIRNLLNTLKTKEETKDAPQQAPVQKGESKVEKAANAEQSQDEKKDAPMAGAFGLASSEQASSEKGAEKRAEKRAEKGVEEGTEEEIFSAFTGSDDGGTGDEEGMDISSDVWEHAALPRSTSGQWAILISLIALVGVVTRPLWAEPIDSKLMGVLDEGGSHATQHTASDGKGQDAEHSQDAAASSDETAGTGTDSVGTALSSALPRDLLVRLEGLERDMEAVSAQQQTPATAELRRLKSEGDALAASFDNQSARLDSLVELLQQRTKALSRLRGQVERLEKNRATERLSRRLNALFQLENIAYAIAQRNTFSLDALESLLASSLSREERAQLEEALVSLERGNDLPSSQQLLADYRRLLPDLMVWRADNNVEQDEERGVAARWAHKLRAQVFGIFSVRRRYGDEESALLQVERMLDDGRLQQAEELLAKAVPSRAQAREQLGEDVAARLDAFRATLSVQNGVFAALHDIRAVLSGFDPSEPTSLAPSLPAPSLPAPASRSPSS